MIWVVDYPRCCGTMGKTTFGGSYPRMLAQIHARGEWIRFCDDDDVMLRHALEFQVRRAKQVRLGRGSALPLPPPGPRAPARALPLSR